jgi:O-antigen/teichoic acid export membrane protein
MNLLYSEKFITGVSVFRVFCLVLLLRFTYFGMILNAVGNTKFIFYSSIFSLFLNFCLNYVFLVSLGFIGPAIATLISQFVINVIQLVYTCKIIKIKFIEILPWKILGFILLINISFGWIFYVIKENIELDVLLGSIFESIILGTIWGGIYLLLFRKTINKSWRVLNTK